jgi:cell division transport system permease protein
MSSPASELLLEDDPTSRFVRPLIAVLTFLAGVAILSALGLQALVSGWQAGLTGRATVVIAGVEDPAAPPLGERINRVMAALEAEPAVSAAVVIDTDATRALIAPWLGEDSGWLGLPIPTLIDVRMNITAASDLSATLAAVGPGIRLDDHGAWLGPARRTLAILGGVSWLCTALVALILVATIAYTVTISLQLHAATLELLNIMGASRFYIAARFQRQAVLDGGRGAILGALGATMLVLPALGWHLVARPPDVQPLLGWELFLAQAVAMAVLPAVVAVICWLSARITVLRTLAQLT